MENRKRYIKIYEIVKADIIDGRYEKGSKLPSKRVMADQTGVSVVTVEHAYELLNDEGYVTSVEKSGYFVTYDDREIYTGADTTRSYERIKIHDVGKVKNEGTGDAEEFSYTVYAKTVRRVLSDKQDFVTEKSPKYGTMELRCAVSDYLNRSRRLLVSPEQIIIGAGAEYLYGLIVQTFGRNITYGVESPSYQKIAKVYEAGGAKIKMLKLGKDGIESSELWGEKMGLIHITPYRSFPSGVTASASKKREYLNWSKKSSGYIIEDDFESEFTPSRKPEETLFSLDCDGKVVYINTFTKTIGNFVRVAYMVLPENLLDLFNEKIGFYECPVPTLDQFVIAELMDNGDFERHINKVRRAKRRQKKEKN